FTSCPYTTLFRSRVSYQPRRLAAARSACYEARRPALVTSRSVSSRTIRDLEREPLYLRTPGRRPVLQRPPLRRRMAHHRAAQIGTADVAGDGLSGTATGSAHSALADAGGDQESVHCRTGRERGEDGAGEGNRTLVLSRVGTRPHGRVPP